ncbi:hypothetical protein AnigIFM56816_002278 [Aspergillus niger]|nr:hypothetical protein AnigIFM56816_002278 [Aspergillus niger]
MQEDEQQQQQQQQQQADELIEADGHGMSHVKVSASWPAGEEARRNATPIILVNAHSSTDWVLLQVFC